MLFGRLDQDWAGQFSIRISEWSQCANANTLRATSGHSVLTVRCQWVWRPKDERAIRNGELRLRWVQKVPKDWRVAMCHAQAIWAPRFGRDARTEREG